MILEGCPFLFWSDKMSKMEEHHFNYQEQELKQIDHELPQWTIYHKTHDYEKIIKFFHKFLEICGDSRSGDRRMLQ